MPGINPIRFCWRCCMTVSTSGGNPSCFLCHFLILKIISNYAVCIRIDPMSFPAPSASTTSTIKVSTRVEDRPAKLVSSGYVAILIGLVLLVWAGLTAYGAFSRNPYGDIHFSSLGLLGLLCFLALSAVSSVLISSLVPTRTMLL